MTVGELDIDQPVQYSIRQRVLAVLKSTNYFLH